MVHSGDGKYGKIKYKNIKQFRKTIPTKMAREERPDRTVVENVQPTATEVKTPISFGPGVRPYNPMDILVDIDGGDIDFYLVVEVDDKQTILNSGDGAMGIKTKLVRKLVESGAWKVYTEGFKIQQSLDTTPPVEKKPPPKKANNKQRDRSERPTRR